MLYIYSGEVPELNDALIKRLGRHHTLTIIPASTRDMASARHTTEYFRHVGLRARLQSIRFYRDPQRLRQLFKNSDAVYLMGGNTFEFLAYARRVGLFEILRDYEQSGGLILADSAGSIIMSPNIATALIPTTCPDEHRIQLDSYVGMGRIPFHISPHFEADAAVSENELHELQALAYYSKCPVMVLQDGEGFIMTGDRIKEVVGDPLELTPDVAPPQSLDITQILPVWASVVPT